MINKIPIVFAFDDNYALPASIAIKSLLDYKKADTEYEIFILHGGLKKSTMQKMETITHINWIKVNKNDLNHAPKSELWPLSVYYRLLIATELPMYDKIIWSDVDVLFQGDLAEIYSQSMDGYDWAGVIAEKQSETKGIHTHFAENNNPYIYMSGFMVINAQKWRQDNLEEKFFQTILSYQDRLKMFDLDVLNLTCHHIKAVPFEYCVLENIFEEEDIANAPEFPWLSNVYGRTALEKAKHNAIIIHYAGKSPKIWKRAIEDIPNYYLEYIKTSLYNPEFYYPTWITKLQISLLWILTKLCLVKPWRKKLKQFRKTNYANKSHKKR